MNIKHLAAIVAVALAIAGCSESTDPSSEPTMTMTARMTSTTAAPSAIRPDSPRTEGGRLIDSVRVDKVRILLSRIKLHRTNDDTSNGGKDVKIGPAVLTIDNDTVTTVFASAIPTGTYERMKLEKHKFSGSEAAQYAADPVFGPFAFPDRVTLIVDGTVYAEGETRAFTLTDDRTENLWVGFDPALTVTESTSTTVDLEFSARLLFNVDGNILDPLDVSLRDVIRARLKNAFKLKKR